MCKCLVYSLVGVSVITAVAISICCLSEIYKNWKEKKKVNLEKKDDL